MSTDDLKFGTSGLRGLVSLLDGPPAFNWTFAFAQMLLERGTIRPGDPVFIGRDLRSSSPAISRRVATAIAACGLVPVDCGELPTPAMAFHAMRLRAASIMVTGSHIPDDRNGLKFYTPSGEITKPDETAIIACHQGRSPVQTAGAGDFAADAHDKAMVQYLDRYRAAFEPSALAGLTVGVYQHSSVARDMLAEILSDLGANPVALGRSNVFVPVDTEALRDEDIALLREWAGERRLDAIVSTDGDADRPLVADEKGEFVRGDLVGAITASHLGARTVVTPVTSNSALETCRSFASVRRTRVGSPFVIEAMADAASHGLVVGFEANGGVMLGAGAPDLEPLPTRDAFLPILCTLARIAIEQKPLSAIAASYAFRQMLADRLQNVDMVAVGTFLDRLRADHEYRARVFEDHGGVAQVNLVDGVRIQVANGDIVHFRASGNAPEIRCYVEAKTGNKARELLRWGLTILLAHATGTC